MSRNDVYGEYIEVGDFVIKAAQNKPDYAIVLDFVDNVGAKGSKFEYHWETVRVISNQQKAGNTHCNRLLYVEDSQVPKEVRESLKQKYRDYKAKQPVKGAKN